MLGELRLAVAPCMQIISASQNVLVTHVTVMKIGVLSNRSVCDQIRAVEQSL